MEAITREEQLMAAAAGQAVKLPEPITRREKFLKAIAERGGGAQPDWNQNDPSAPDYVKNRTHYEEEEEVVLLPEELYTFEDLGNPVYTWMHGFVTDSSNELVAGETYSVVWDGVQYDNLVCEVDAEEGYVRIGGIMTPDGIDGYDFAILYGYGSLELYTASTETSHSVCIICRKTAVHKLDAKYLPDSMGRTYRFTGYNEADIFILESGDMMEYEEMLNNGLVDTAEVVNYSEWQPEVLPLVTVSFGEGGVNLHFQKVWFDPDSMEVVGKEVVISPVGNYYVKLPTSGGGDSGAPG